MVRYLKSFGKKALNAGVVVPKDRLLVITNDMVRTESLDESIKTWFRDDTSNLKTRDDKKIKSLIICHWQKGTA